MSRTSPFFIPQKEIDMIDSMNEELIDEIVGQSVDIYKVNIERTNENVYGESSTKYYDYIQDDLQSIVVQLFHLFPNKNHSNQQYHHSQDKN